MTKANEFIGRDRQAIARGAGEHAGAAFGPVMQSAVGLVRESANLLSNIADLGAALVLVTKSATPTSHAAKAANIIPFPANRRSNRLN